jgi:hypothetical protein
VAYKKGKTYLPTMLYWLIVVCTEYTDILPSAFLYESSTIKYNLTVTYSLNSIVCNCSTLAWKVHFEVAEGRYVGKETWLMTVLGITRGVQVTCGRSLLTCGCRV